MHIPAPTTDTTRRPARTAMLLLGLLLGAGLTGLAQAHGGQIEIGGGARGPVSLDAAQQKAIALTLVPAAPRPLSTLLDLNGDVQLMPNRQADVSLRISGQVTALYAGLGDTVRAGQPLARVQSRLVGDPPPSVTVTAPMGGVIDARNAVIGQAVDPATPLFHLSDRSQLDVVARVYEADLGKVRIGQPAHVRVLSYPGTVFDGKVTLIGPNLDPQTRTVQVWVQVANPRGLLKPHMFARASLILGRNDAALTIPTASIIEANGEKFVFVREGDKFQRVDIKLGAQDDAYAEVLDGLVPGDEVATQGNRQIYTLWLTGGAAKAQE